MLHFCGDNSWQQIYNVKPNTRWAEGEKTATMLDIDTIAANIPPHASAFQLRKTVGNLRRKSREDLQLLSRDSTQKIHT